MANISLNTYSSGAVLTADQLNADNRAIETKINGQIDVDNLVEKYAIVAYPFYFTQISTETRKFKVRINTDSIITKIDFSIVNNTASDNLQLTVQKADDFASIGSPAAILTDTLTGNATSHGSAVTHSRSDSLSTDNYVLFELVRVGSSSTFSDINVTLTIKTLLQA
tara:strand:- start:180 stop:680 length:501 start_codon:yes stop_codon:yes gene_type:complete